MNLLWWGDTIQNSNWGVTENTNCGYIRVYYIISGEIVYQDKYGKTDLKIGNIYMFPSHLPYEIIHNNSVEFRCVWMHINALPHTLQKLICIDKTYSKIYFNSFQLFQSLINQQNTLEDAIQSCCNIFMLQCYKDNLLNKINIKFYNIVEDLEKKSLGELQIKDFAKLHGYTPEHFIREFKKNVKESPYQFVINCKMSRARELLRTNKSISEISELIGYSDIKTFARIFKKKHGISASEYRKNIYYYI